MCLKPILKKPPSKTPSNTHVCRADVGAERRIAHALGRLKKEEEARARVHNAGLLSEQGSQAHDYPHEVWSLLRGSQQRRLSKEREEINRNEAPTLWGAISQANVTLEHFLEFSYEARRLDLMETLLKLVWRKPSTNFNHGSLPWAVRGHFFANAMLPSFGRHEGQ